MNFQQKNIPENQIKNERAWYASFVFSSLAVLLFVAIDQTVKYKIFLERSEHPFIVPFKNYNFAFSLHMPIFIMYGVYTLVLGLILYHFFRSFKMFSFAQTAAWVLIISGAIANIGERIVLGYVRDFILVLSGIFNLADGYIIIGVLLLVINNPRHKTIV